MYEFLAVVTHARIYAPPTPLPDALLQIQAWMESASLVLLGESEGFFPMLEKMLRKSRVVGAGVHDARIAALCVSHGVKTLLSADRDFSRFPQLRTRNPLS